MVLSEGFKNIFVRMTIEVGIRAEDVSHVSCVDDECKVQSSPVFNPVAPISREVDADTFIRRTVRHAPHL